MIRYAIRGATLEDEAHLLALARHLNTVNLPYDPASVREILELSVRSFSGALKDPRRREYVFVLEDLVEHRVIGSSKIIAQLGRRDAPYIYFDVIIEERYSPTVDRHFVHTVLRLGHSYEGPTEIGGLIVLPECRQSPEKLGLMISYVRFLFMAMHRGLFRNEVVAELLPPLLPGRQEPALGVPGEKVHGHDVPGGRHALQAQQGVHQVAVSRGGYLLFPVPLGGPGRRGQGGARDPRRREAPAPYRVPVLQPHRSV